jgi:hypothetical protein
MCSVLYVEEGGGGVVAETPSPTQMNHVTSCTSHTSLASVLSSKIVLSASLLLGHTLCAALLGI